MGTSAGYGGSGGAWNGSGINGFVDDPSEDAAEELAGHALDALVSEDDPGEDAALTPQVHPPVDRPGAVAVPGLRVRGPRGAGGGGGGGSGGGGRAGGGGGGRGRSRSQAAAAGGRAIAAGLALARGDEAALRELGLAVTELEGLTVFDQIRRILDVTVPATGAPQEAEIRGAAAEALIAVLKNGETDPNKVVRTFVVEHAFEALVTEHGEKIRAADDPKRAETLLRDAVQAYTEQVNLPATRLGADDLRDAISEVLTKAQQLVPG